MTILFSALVILMAYNMVYFLRAQHYGWATFSAFLLGYDVVVLIGLLNG